MGPKKKPTISQRIKKFYNKIFANSFLLLCLFVSISVDTLKCTWSVLNLALWSHAHLLCSEGVYMNTCKFAWTSVHVKPNIQTAFDISIRCWAYGSEQSLSALELCDQNSNNRIFFGIERVMVPLSSITSPMKHNCLFVVWILWRKGYWRAPQQLQRLITNHFIINNHHRQMADILPYSIKS